MTNYYIFIYKDSDKLKTDLLTNENFDLKTVNDLEIFIINNKNFIPCRIYHFIDSHIDKETIFDHASNLPVILDQNNIIIDWQELLNVISANHGIDVVNDEVKLIILNKI